MYVLEFPVVPRFDRTRYFVCLDANGVGPTNSTWDALNSGHSFVHVGVPT
jgi:hypothetical protein